MRLYLLVLLYLISIINCHAQTESVHKVTKVAHIKSNGGWDYIKVNNGKVYVTHSSQVNILDEATGDSVGVIPGTLGVHGVAFDNENNKGFTSNGRGGNVTVFDLKTNKIITQIPVGQGPDAIIYDPFTKRIITCNGKSHDLSVIDPVTNTLIATISLEAVPEESVSDGKGKLYVNLEDLGEIAIIDLTANKMLDRYTLSPGEGPTALDMDIKTNRLFSTCSESKQLVVVDAANGRKIARLPIGEGCDGVVFDNDTKLIYASNGEGTITVVKEVSADEFKVIETIKTKAGARTIALDPKTKTLFLPTADFEPLDPKANKNERRKMIPGSLQVLVIQ
jgi:YVTN family beta-propeller protein